MAKFYGAIGYAIQEETAPDVYHETIRERFYYGSLERNTRRLQVAESVNDDVSISNSISIIADPYAQQNFHAIRYAVFMGTKWKVSSVDVQYPKLILTLGGVYNGRTGPESNAKSTPKLS